MKTQIQVSIIIITLFVLVNLSDGCIKQQSERPERPIHPELTMIGAEPKSIEFLEGTLDDEKEEEEVADCPEESDCDDETDDDIDKNDFEQMCDQVKV